MIMDELKSCFLLHCVVDRTLSRQCNSLSKGTPVVYLDLSTLNSHMDDSYLRLLFVLNKGNYSESTIIVNNRIRFSVKLYMHKYINMT